MMIKLTSDMKRWKGFITYGIHRVSPRVVLYRDKTSSILLERYYVVLDIWGSIVSIVLGILILVLTPFAFIPSIAMFTGTDEELEFVDELHQKSLEAVNQVFGQKGKVE